MCVHDSTSPAYLPVQLVTVPVNQQQATPTSSPMGGGGRVRYYVRELASDSDRDSLYYDRRRHQGQGRKALKYKVRSRTYNKELHRFDYKVMVL